MLRITWIKFNKLTEAESLSLEEEFNTEEVWLAVANCDGNQAPSPDGLKLNFIKAYWGEIKEDYMKFISEFHKDGRIVKDLNRAFIALIPKVGVNCLLLKARNLDLIRGERFDNNNVHISHLHFTDETILFIKPRIDYLLNVKRVLQYFKLASGLKINFHKSCVVRVKIGRAVESVYWASIFKCKKLTLPIPYLGFPLGGKPGSKNFWNALLLKVEKRSMESLLKASSRTAKVIEEGFVTIVGNGNRANFWTDLQVDGRPLKKAFPRCFALASMKSGVIQNFDCIPIHNNIPDAMAWSGTSRGIFSVGSYRKALENNQEGSEPVPSIFWKGFCTPKMEFFVWQMLKGRTLVIEKLFRYCRDSIPSLDCPLCRIEKESIDHLFLHCSWSNALWKSCMAWWGVVYCSNKTVNEWLKGWRHLYPTSKNERVRTYLFLAMVWTIWESRNLLVFEGKNSCVHMAADLIKFRIVWWFKHLGKGAQKPIQSLLLNLKDLCVESKMVKRTSMANWIPPVGDNLKFNINGSSRGKLWLQR
ncbi:hypothetical protein Ddye_009392 [Dipteronia dyeriana]|uniref:Reverse transcriptase zinc-binding domain-containing protein n=1 Tax=Dipteronia dyeriana TaxID=168575 RepID=A0AAD9XB96_9ROSI|nr:hypothetical protein Ddye_009392 [Dipteronia dyeriana]